MSTSLLPRLLALGLRHRLTAPDAEAAFAAFRTVGGEEPEPAAFHEAVAEALARGLIRDPVRIPEGALQCQWHLELTPAGVAAARALPAGD